MSDRFELEQQILDCWHVTKDINDVFEYVCDGPQEPNREDKIANMLLGMMELYDYKFDKLFRIMEKMVNESKIK